MEWPGRALKATGSRRIRQEGAASLKAQGRIFLDASV